MPPKAAAAGKDITRVPSDPDSAQRGPTPAPKDGGWAFQRAQSNASLEIAKQLLAAKKAVQAADAGTSASDIGRSTSAPEEESASDSSVFIRRVASDAEPVDRTAKLKALLEAHKTRESEQNDALDKLRNGAKNIFGKASATQPTAEDAKTSSPASKSPGAAASKEEKAAALLSSAAGSRASKLLQQAKAQATSNTARKADFMETMSKIGGKGKPLSPRSQRLLGGLSGDKYKDLKAEHIPSEREKQRLAEQARKAKENAANAEEEEDDFDPNLASPNTIIRRAKKASAASKATMAQVNEILGQSSKLIANQFKGMSERRLKERIKISFDTYDTSKDGLLQADEVQKALTGLGQTLTLEQAHEFIRTNAQDNNPDALTLDDFERVVRVMLFGSEAGISRVQSSDTSEAAAIIAAQEAAGAAAS